MIQIFPVVGDMTLPLYDWFMKYPIASSSQAIVIGTGIGAVMLGLRKILGLGERGMVSEE